MGRLDFSAVVFEQYMEQILVPIKSRLWLVE